MFGDILETKEILQSIEKSIKNKNQIVRNLKSLIEVAKIHNLISVFEWAHWELYGYKEIESIPQYRKLDVKAHKLASPWVNWSISNIAF